jgi:Bacterial Ig domain
MSGRRMGARVLLIVGLAVGMICVAVGSAAGETTTTRYALSSIYGAAGEEPEGIQFYCLGLDGAPGTCNSPRLTLTRGGSTIAELMVNDDEGKTLPVALQPGDVLHVFEEGDELISEPLDESPKIETPLACGTRSAMGKAGAKFEEQEPYSPPHASVSGPSGFESWNMKLAGGNFYAAAPEQGRSIGPGDVLDVQVGRHEWFYRNPATEEGYVEFFVQSDTFAKPCPAVPSPSGPPAAPNRPPVAHKDYGQSSGRPTSGNLLTNDEDPDGDPLTLVGNTSGAFGKVSCSPSGDCTYTPGKKYAGHDSFSYTISDGRGGTSSARDFIREKPLPAGEFFVLHESYEPCGQYGGYIENANSSDSHQFNYAWKLGFFAGDTPLANTFGFTTNVSSTRCDNADLISIDYGYNPRSYFATDGYEGLEWAAGVEFQFRYAGTSKWITCRKDGCFRHFKIANTEGHSFGLPGDKGQYECAGCVIPTAHHLVYSASVKQPIAEVRYILATSYAGGYTQYKCRVAKLGAGFKDESHSECIAH